jgi:phage-related protein
MALNGEMHEDAKPFKYHGSGVFEVVGDHRGDTFREIYTVRHEEVVFVIHIFQKKSKKGAETPKQDKELIKQRLKWAEQIHKEQYVKKKKKS